jgi:hypothetical protein
MGSGNQREGSSKATDASYSGKGKTTSCLLPKQALWCPITQAF